MTTKAQRARYEKWLLDLTAIPTAAGHEHGVIDWIVDWVRARRNLRLRRDAAGNLLITRTGRRSGRPVFITAHLDHPAFVVSSVGDDGTLELEFRGGVHPPYFERAPIDVFDRDHRRHRATITDLDASAQPFKRVTARLGRRSTSIAPGDIGRWVLRGRLPRITRGLLHTHACDDLAAVAAALATLDALRGRRGAGNVGVLLTRAEEIGFVGAIAAAKGGSVPKTARLICLENSRSFAESPIGGGPILRVGDRLSVFSPTLTNRLGDIMTAHAAKHPDFNWQRKLMPGGACEATAFATYGYESTCICLPLGNYHNMADIDGVLAGKRPARVGPEFISVDDFHGMVEMLVVCTTQLDSARVAPIRKRLDKLLAERSFVLES